MTKINSFPMTLKPLRLSRVVRERRLVRNRSKPALVVPPRRRLIAHALHG
jgi:hypothetical protein